MFSVVPSHLEQAEVDYSLLLVPQLYVDVHAASGECLFKKEMTLHPRCTA